MSEMIEEIGQTIGKLEGAESIAFAVLVASLHAQGACDGKAIARALRLQGVQDEYAQACLERRADAIERWIEEAVAVGPKVT